MNGPIHVLHVAGSAQWAGGERFLLQMTDRLDRRQFRLSIVLPEEGPLEEVLKKRDVPCAVVPMAPLGNLRPVSALRRIIDRWEPRLIQSHGARANFYARLSSGKRPCISTIHKSLSDYPVSALRKWLYRTADRVTAPRSAAVVCVAECLREDFLKRCPGLWEKSHVIPNGVDLDRFSLRRQERETVRAELGLGDRWTLALVGRMVEQKGHAVLLEALKGLKNTLPPFRVLFAGDGPLKASLMERAHALGLSENIVFLGIRNDVPRVLSATDVLLLPSLSEGLPYVLLEALAMGKVVIASEVDGVKEVMPTGEEGYLVPPSSPDKLMEALLTAHWNKDDAQTRAETGRRRVQREYDLRKTLARWESLYRELSGDLLIK